MIKEGSLDVESMKVAVDDIENRSKLYLNKDEIDQILEN